MALEDHFRGLGDIKIDEPKKMPAGAHATAAATAAFAAEPTPAGVEAAMVLVAADARQGRGFIVDGKGHIAADCDLVNGASRIKVTSPDGDIFLARLLHKDEKRNLALLEIPFATPNHLKLGDIGSTDVGEEILVVSRRGNSLEMGKAIITALRRINGVAVIQFDGGRELGSQGTPVMTRNGQVLGVCSSKFESSQENVGFAVSVNELKALMLADWNDFRS